MFCLSVMDNSGEGPDTHIPDNTSHWVEAVVITLYLLFCGLQILDWYYNERSQKTGTPVPPPDTDVIPASTQQVTVSDVEKVFRSNCQDYQTTTLKEINVYSVPLEAPFRSSPPSARSRIQRQFLPVDYHAFITFKTSDGMWFSLDKMPGGIFVSRGESRESVLFYFQKKPRANPVHLLVQDESTSSLGDIVRRLKYILPQNRYDAIESNCQHFARQIFDKFAADKTWELTTLTDVTSPLTLLSNRGFPLFALLWSVSLIYELYLLLNESTQNETSYHYQYVVYMVILVSSVLLYFNDKENIDIMGVAICFMLFCVLIVEGIFSTPLGTFRKRGAQYGEMWRSGGILYKCWLPLCYGMVYVPIIFVWLVFTPLAILRVLLNYLTKHVPALSPVRDIITWLYDLAKMSYTALFTTCYVVTVIYFSLQD